MENFKDAPRLFFNKASVANYNYEKLSNTATPVARICAVHSGRNAKAATSDDAGGLEAVIFLARGAAVMLTCNLWQEVGLCNSASGVVHDLIFHPERPPPCLPIAALVDFQHYTQDHLSCTHTLRLSQYHHTYLNGKLKGNDCQDSNHHFGYAMQ